MLDLQKILWNEVLQWHLEWREGDARSTWGGGYLSQPIARKCEALAVSGLATYGDEIDVIAPVEILKQIFKTPYSKAGLSVAVHRVGGTLILNSGSDVAAKAEGAAVARAARQKHKHKPDSNGSARNGSSDDNDDDNNGSSGGGSISRAVSLSVSVCDSALYSNFVQHSVRAPLTPDYEIDGVDEGVGSSGRGRSPDSAAAAALPGFSPPPAQAQAQQQQRQQQQQQQQQQEEEAEEQEEQQPNWVWGMPAGSDNGGDNDDNNGGRRSQSQREGEGEGENAGSGSAAAAAAAAERSFGVTAAASARASPRPGGRPGLSQRLDATCAHERDRQGGHGGRPKGKGGAQAWSQARDQARDQVRDQSQGAHTKQQQQQAQPQQQPQQKGTGKEKGKGGGGAEARGFLRVFVWQFQRLHMLLGSDLLVCSNEQHAAVSLHLMDVRTQVSPLAWLDAWLDNVMAGVPEMAVCYHRNGVVQGYELLKTDAVLLAKGGGALHARVVQKNGAAVLRFLRHHCTRDPGSYWLHKDAGEDLLQLYDLSAMTQRHRHHHQHQQPQPRRGGKDGPSGGGGLLEKTAEGEREEEQHKQVEKEQEQKQEQKQAEKEQEQEHEAEQEAEDEEEEDELEEQDETEEEEEQEEEEDSRGLMLPLAMILYRLAQRLSHSQAAEDRRKCAAIFAKCLELLREEEHPGLRAIAHEHLARLFSTCHEELEAPPPSAGTFSLADADDDADALSPEHHHFRLPAPESPGQVPAGGGGSNGEKGQSGGAPAKLSGAARQVSRKMLPGGGGGGTATWRYLQEQEEIEAEAATAAAAAAEEAGEQEEEDNERQQRRQRRQRRGATEVPPVSAVSAHLIAVDHLSRAIKVLRWKRQILEEKQKLDLMRARGLLMDVSWGKGEGQGQGAGGEGRGSAGLLCVCGEADCLSRETEPFPHRASSGAGAGTGQADGGEVGGMGWGEGGEGVQTQLLARGAGEKKMRQLIVLLGDSYLALGKAYFGQRQLGRALRAAELACLLSGALHFTPAAAAAAAAETGDEEDSSASPRLEAGGSRPEAATTAAASPNPYALTAYGQDSFWGGLWVFVGDVYVDFQRSLGGGDHDGAGGGELASQQEAARAAELRIDADVIREVKRLRKKSGRQGGATPVFSCSGCSRSGCSCLSDRASSHSSASSSSSGSSSTTRLSAGAPPGGGQLPSRPRRSRPSGHARSQDGGGGNGGFGGNQPNAAPDTCQRSEAPGGARPGEESGAEAAHVRDQGTAVTAAAAAAAAAAGAGAGAGKGKEEGKGGSGSGEGGVKKADPPPPGGPSSQASTCFGRPMTLDWEMNLSAAAEYYAAAAAAFASSSLASGNNVLTGTPVKVAGAAGGVQWEAAVRKCGWVWNELGRRRLAGGRATAAVAAFEAAAASFRRVGDVTNVALVYCNLGHSRRAAAERFTASLQLAGGTAVRPLFADRAEREFLVGRARQLYAEALQFYDTARRELLRQGEGAERSLAGLWREVHTQFAHTYLRLGMLLAPLERAAALGGSTGAKAPGGNAASGAKSRGAKPPAAQPRDTREKGGNGGGEQKSRAARARESAGEGGGQAGHLSAQEAITKALALYESLGPARSQEAAFAHFQLAGHHRDRALQAADSWRSEGALEDFQRTRRRQHQHQQYQQLQQQMKHYGSLAELHWLRASSFYSAHSHPDMCVSILTERAALCQEVAPPHKALQAMEEALCHLLEARHTMQPPPQTPMPPPSPLSPSSPSTQQQERQQQQQQGASPSTPGRGPEVEEEEEEKGKKEQQQQEEGEGGDGGRAAGKARARVQLSEAGRQKLCEALRLLLKKFLGACLAASKQQGRPAPAPAQHRGGGSGGGGGDSALPAGKSSESSKSSKEEILLERLREIYKLALVRDDRVDVDRMHRIWISG